MNASELEKDRPVIILDNVEVIKVLVELNVLHLMKPIEGANQTYHAFDTEHHWCMATYHTGHDDELNNGYTLVKLPKSKTSEDQAVDFFADMIKNTSRTQRVQWKPIKPLSVN